MRQVYIARESSKDSLTHYGIKGMKWHKHIKAKLILPGTSGEKKSIISEATKQAENSPSSKINFHDMIGNRYSRKVYKKWKSNGGVVLSDKSKKKLDYFIKQLGFGNKSHTRY